MAKTAVSKTANGGSNPSSSGLRSCSFCCRIFLWFFVHFLTELSFQLVPLPFYIVEDQKRIAGTDYPF